jgi:hypothetical protein
LTCERTKCENVYHFSCALKIDCHFINYITYCPGCSKSYGLSPGYSDPKILDTKRRLYIVKHEELVSYPLRDNKIKIDTWRPYFYDSFNRVGNCTILSLCENVDALIKVIKGGSLSLHSDSLSSRTAFFSNTNFSLRPYTSLRIYWKIVNDTTLSPEMLNSSDNI